MIKDGLALEFLIELFVTYKQEVGTAHLLTVLKKGGLESRLMDFLPPNKRTEENLRAQFEEKGLGDVVKLHLAQASQEAKRNLEVQLHDDLNDGKNMKEIISNIKELSSKHDIPEHEIIVLVIILITWRCKVGELLSVAKYSFYVIKHCYLGLECCNETSGVEQKRGTFSRSGT